jgi:hypothetical protein
MTRGRTERPHLRSVLPVVCAAFLGCASEAMDEGERAEGAVTAASAPPLNEEAVGEGEEAMFRELADAVRELQKQAATRTGTAISRGFHAKVHGCTAARFQVAKDIPEDARVGVFAAGGSDESPSPTMQPTTPGGSFEVAHEYRAWVRFSNGMGTRQADSRLDTKGLAIKLVGVPGEKIVPEESAAKTQDFVFLNSPFSNAGDPRKIVEIGRATSSPAQLAAFFVKNPRIAAHTAKQLAHKVHSVLSERYWSTTPFKLGKRAIKYSVTPCEDLHASSPVFLPDDYYREDLAKRLDASGACFDFAVQFQTDASRMPIEDSSVEWDESESPPVRIGRLLLDRPGPSVDPVLAKQQEEACENLGFSIWHSLPEHRPLGVMNRARRVIYETSRSTRKAAPEPE